MMSATLLAMPESSMSYQVGQRVEIHPCTDWWMMGARFGIITGVDRSGLLSVKLDKVKKEIIVPPQLITEKVA